MPVTVRYLTHPQVLVDPQQEVGRWSLNPTGRARVRALAEGVAAGLGALSRTARVISSYETKAIETASPLALELGVPLEILPDMHENDRSATGFLPPVEFEAVADQFFAEPGISVRGWETAEAAQARILAAVTACLEGPQPGDVLLVGHGAVGTLLYCALAGLGIDRRHDQGPGGGGRWFGFDLDDRRPGPGWQPMETLLAEG